MNRGDLIKGLVTGLILAALFLKWSFDAYIPDRTMALVTGAVLVGGTIIMFVILGRSGSRKDNSQKDKRD